MSVLCLRKVRALILFPFDKVLYDGLSFTQKDRNVIFLKDQVACLFAQWNLNKKKMFVNSDYLSFFFFNR